MGKKAPNPDGRTDGRADGRADITAGKSTEEIARKLSNEERLLLRTLEQLLAIGGSDLNSVLDHASTLISKVTQVDKIDVFLFDPTVSTLVAMGTSDTQMAREQKRLGLDRVPLANGGRIVETFQTGKSFCSGRADLDPGVSPGFKDALGVKSMAAVAIDIAGEKRGVLHVASLKPDAFTESDLYFFEAAAHWLGIVTEKAELAEQVARDSAEQARHVVAEELVTTLAHDLRNYLTPIKGHLQIISQRARRDNRSADIRSIDAAMDGVSRLSTLINDLLDVARLEQGIFETHVVPVDLAVLVDESGAVFRGLGSTLNLRLPEELVVEADSGRIQQALDNLIANAIKHSPKGTPVTVELEAETREDGEWAVVTVRDEGPGIDAKILPRLFTKFGSGGDSAGLGLGLYLARGIAEAHGGSLTVETALGRGASFKLSLPVERRAKVDSLRTLAFSADGSKPGGRKS